MSPCIFCSRAAGSVDSPIGVVCHVCCEVLFHLAEGPLAASLWRTEASKSADTALRDDVLPDYGSPMGELVRQAVEAGEQLLEGKQIEDIHDIDAVTLLDMAEGFLDAGLFSDALREVLEGYHRAETGGPEHARALALLLDGRLLREDGIQALSNVLTRLRS